MRHHPPALVFALLLGCARSPEALQDCSGETSDELDIDWPVREDGSLEVRVLRYSFTETTPASEVVPLADMVVDVQTQQGLVGLVDPEVAPADRVPMESWQGTTAEDGGLTVYILPFDAEALEVGDTEELLLEAECGQIVQGFSFVD